MKNVSPATITCLGSRGGGGREKSESGIGGAGAELSNAFILTNSSFEGAAPGGSLNLLMKWIVFFLSK